LLDYIGHKRTKASDKPSPTEKNRNFRIKGGSKQPGYDSSIKTAEQLEQDYSKLFEENKEEIQKFEELKVFKNERLKEYIVRE
jgi:hypothetical protein